MLRAIVYKGKTEIIRKWKITYSKKFNKYSTFAKPLVNYCLDAIHCLFAVDYEAPPVPLDQEYASATALSLGIAIAVMAIIVAALLAAYFVKRKGGFKRTPNTDELREPCLWIRE